MGQVVGVLWWGIYSDVGGGEYVKVLVSLEW